MKKIIVTIAASALMVASAGVALAGAAPDSVNWSRHAPQGLASVNWGEADVCPESDSVNWGAKFNTLAGVNGTDSVNWSAKLTTTLASVNWGGADSVNWS